MMVGQAHVQRQRLLWGFLLMLAIGWTLWASLSPVDDLPAVQVWDKFAHAFNYGLLTLLLFVARPQTGRIAGALLVLAFGGVVELLQWSGGARHGEWADMLANLVGVATALGLHMAWCRWRSGV